MRRDSLLLVVLVVLVFTLAGWVQPRMVRTVGGRDADNVFKVLFGEGRRMFANQFAAKADVYLHSGFYPSIFDQAAAVEKAQMEGQETSDTHVHTADCDHDHEDAESMPDGHKCDTSFMGAPKDWIEAMGRHFFVTEHAHLEGGKEREVLPWLKLSAELDPQRIETYTVGAYWLERMDKPKEAEEFLREGLKANPQSYEILFELGRIYHTNFEQSERARGLWKLALRRWDEVESGKEEPDKLGRERILVYLGQLESEQGHFEESIRYFEEAKPYAPSPAALEERIREIRQRIAQPH